MTKELIEDLRKSLIPFVKKELLEINYEGLGKSDAEEFEKDLNEVLDLASKALEQPTSDDCVSRAEVFEIMGNLMSIPYDFDRPINKDDVSESMDKIKSLPSVTPTRNKPKEDITEDEVKINMLELAFNQAKEHAESIEVLTDNHRLIFKAKKRGSENVSS